MQDNINELFDFLSSSVSPYHTVKTVVEMLEKAGYSRLSEKEKVAPVGKYYVINDGSSVIAFDKKENQNGFMIAAAHSDSPTFRVKSASDGTYAKLNVEKYGGMIYYSWLDRPLSVAGRVVVKTENGVKALPVNIDRDLCVIPSVAIHMNRSLNDGLTLNPAVDLLPLFGNDKTANVLLDEIASEIGCKTEDIVAHDLFLYNRAKGVIFGAQNEFYLAPRIDDLACVYAATRAFLDCENDKATNVLAVFNNEEVGSATKQGAESTFLSDTLAKIVGGRKNLTAQLTDSFMVSADNGHAVHPNHPEYADKTNAPVVNGGLLIKYNANQRYTTDGISAAIFTRLCDKVGARRQNYFNRADVAGGGTLGSIANTKVSVSTVDIGLPQLAMHSATETAGVSDLDDMIKALGSLYSSAIVHDGDEYKIV